LYKEICSTSNENAPIEDKDDDDDGNYHNDDDEN
jgi:hypothetical protein